MFDYFFVFVWRQGEEIETERRKFEVLREEKAEMEMENAAKLQAASCESRLFEFCLEHSTFDIRPRAKEEHIKTLEESHARYLQGQQESFDQKMIVEERVGELEG